MIPFVDGKFDHQGRPVEGALGQAEHSTAEARQDMAATVGLQTGTKMRSMWMLPALVLVGLNLRPALSGVAPLLNQIRADLDLSTAAGGLLTTLPVLCLGLFGPLATGLGRRLGFENTILAALLMLAAGSALRGAGSVAALFLGAILAGGAIGIICVLLPALVKRDFPDRMGLATGAYTMALCFGAAAAAGLTAPIEGWLMALGIKGGWRPALAIWALPALAAAIVWLVPRTRQNGVPEAAKPIAVRGLWRSGLAWQVTLFMGMQSSLSYCVFGWLAPILQDRGLSTVASGLVVSGSALIQVAAAMAAPMLARHGPDQRWLAALTVGLLLAGLFGALTLPLAGLWFSAVLMGLGQGAIFALAVMLIVLRSPDAATAAALSGMSQTVGYTLAAGGPLAIGIIRTWTGGWDAVLGLFLAIGAVALLAGLGAGRNRLIATVDPRR